MRLLFWASFTMLTLLFAEQIIAKPVAASQNNKWYVFNSSDTVFIFVHGIFSNAEDCWTSKSGTYWPKILSQDNRFNNPSIYLGGYFTDFSSGIYRVSNAADELLSFLRVPDYTGKPAPLDKPNIIFVAHSTGGLVVRYMLERKHPLFINKHIGLVLLASPSRGSEWSNRLKWLRKTFKNRMAGQLARDNDFVLDLDSRFSDLIRQKKIPRLVGIDAFENKFIVPGLLFNNSHVVTATDSASYFGSYRIIPNTDHFSIAKPDSLSHPSHQLLYEFYKIRFMGGSESTNILDTLNNGLEATKSIISSIEKIESRILGLSNRKEKEEELNRLIDLLNETRISRTLNAGLLWYLRDSIENYKSGKNQHEIEVAVEQIESSISSMIEIIDTMSEEKDKVVLYENGSWNNLHSVISGRKRLLSELKHIDINEKNIAQIESFANRYEALTRELSFIALRLSKYGREMHKGVN